MDLRYPKITGTSEAAQLVQLKSYLHQLVDQLNMALKDMGGGAAESYADAIKKAADAAKKNSDPVASFNSVKALIIKSADIVAAYYDEISYRLTGMYVAKSDFGDYTEQTALDIQTNADGVSQLYNNVQVITSRMDEVESQSRETRAHINSGVLYYAADGTPVYGLEIGQRNTVGGVETFNKFARFTADRLSFYDQNANEVAYISDKNLYITNVQVTGSFTLGGFKDETQPDSSVVTKWIGG